MSTRVVGVGQPAAGDDAVGIAVVEWLRARPEAGRLDLHVATEAGALLPLLETADPVVIVDAVLVTGPPGDVYDLAPADLARRGRSAWTSHGLGVAEVVELAGVLGQCLAELQVVGVGIARPEGHRVGLSPAVAAAVPRAGGRVLALAGLAKSGLCPLLERSQLFALHEAMHRS